MHNYTTTPLESWIEQLYMTNGINHPHQLTIDEIAPRLNIWVYYTDMASQHIDRKGLYTININRNTSPDEQWSDFLHELCHVLRHSGNQVTMPKLLLQWQEADCANFELYAALPFFMIKQMELPHIDREIIDLWTWEFRVTPELARKRLEQIRRRIMQKMLDDERDKWIAEREQTPIPMGEDLAPNGIVVTYPETERLLQQLYGQIKRRSASN